MREQISLRDKTSLVIDRAKLAEARTILGTRTIAETVDAALQEVLDLAKRRRVLERIRKAGPDGFGPGPKEVGRLRGR